MNITANESELNESYGGDFLISLFSQRWTIYLSTNLRHIIDQDLVKNYSFDTPQELTLLMIAARQGLVTIIEQLIDRGVGLEKEDENKQTALVHAVLCGRTEAVRTLLKLGADCKNLNYPNHLYITPIMAGDAEIVELLLEAGAKTILPGKEYMDNNFLFDLACRGRDSRIVELLLSKSSIDINHQNSNGRSPLYTAVITRSTAISMLIQHGVNVNILTPLGQTILELARETKNHEAEYLLKSAGALETRSKEGKALFLKLTRELIVQVGIDKLGEAAADVVDRLNTITNLSNLRKILKRIQNISPEEEVNMKWENLVK